MEKILISSCLIGEKVKYNGKDNLLENSVLELLMKNYQLIPFCPEVEGGLPIPRVPCEIISTNPIKIINKIGEDKTAHFLKGAEKTLQLCKKEKIKIAILKANSPSCSNNKIYDGTFSSNKTDGLGVTAKLLKQNNIKIINEDEISTLTFFLQG